MTCKEFKELIDSYQRDELIVETNHEVIAHLELCPACRAESAARRELRNKVRSAFLRRPDNQMSTVFAEQLRENLRRATEVSSRDGSSSLFRRATEYSRSRWPALAVAAGLILALVSGLWLLQRQYFRRPSPDSVRVSAPIEMLRTELSQCAAGDHRDCAVHFRLQEKPIDLEAAGQKYDPAYLNLRATVEREVIGQFKGAQLMDAHSCVFEGRRFAHIVMKYNGELVSLLITNYSGGDDNGSLTDIASTTNSGYQIAYFHTLRHAVFVVSELPAGDNLAIARNFAPPVAEHLRLAESLS